MKTRDLVAGATALAVVLGGCAAEAPGWVRASAAGYTRQVALPSPTTDGGVSLERAIATRRSTRSFRPDPLPLSAVGQLLWAAQGVTAPDGKRAAPSAGALYPLELYVVTAHQVMHYLPPTHSLELRDVADLRPRLAAAALGQPVVAAAPDLVVVAAAPERTRRKYGARGEAYVEREAGHATENLLLEATALGLAAVPVGGLDPARATAVLALPPDQTVLYLVPVGWPA